MFIIIVIVSLCISFISLHMVLKEKEKFGQALDNWMSVNDIQNKDIDKIENNEDGTEATLTLKDGRKFVFRWTEDGWVVEEIKTTACFSLVMILSRLSATHLALGVFSLFFTWQFTGPDKISGG